MQDSVQNKEGRRIAAQERRKSHERVQADQLKEKLEADLNKAVEKRLTVRETRMKKIMNHNSRVMTIRTLQAVRRQTSCETLKNEISKRLDEASLKREQQLVSKKIIAMKSAEKKKFSSDGNGAPASTQFNFDQ
jgi:hypothetical protein